MKKNYNVLIFKTHIFIAKLNYVVVSDANYVTCKLDVNYFKLWLQSRQKSIENIPLERKYRKKHILRMLNLSVAIYCIDLSFCYFKIPAST